MGERLYRMMDTTIEENDMMRHSRLTIPLLTVALVVWGLQAFGDQKVTFGFTGEVNAFNRSEGTLVVEDLVFRISEKTLVHKKRNTQATLSDLTPGTRVGFNPDLGPAPYLSEIWILPKYWKAKPGYAVTPGH